MAANDRNALGISVKENDFSLTFDLSTEGTVRKWFFLPPRVDSFSVDATWEDDGGPEGVFTVEVSNTNDATTGTPIAATATTAFVAEQPGHASDTGSFFLDCVPCAAKRMCVAYTRTSGGTGDAATVRVSFKVRG